jgi:hypothetical protein
VKFMIVPKLMKGPWHGGGGGDPNPGQIHNIAIPGTSTFVGQGDDNVNWFDVSNVYPILVSGFFSYTDSKGKRIQLTVSCDGGPCPQFVPQPQIMPGEPKGIVFFRTAQ